MKELIKINQTEKGMTLSARELHTFLEVGRDFSTWIKERIQKYDFVQGKDFSPVSGKTSVTGGRPSIDYELSISMAKELCMVENNEKGSQARKYFIYCEEQLQKMVVPSYMIEDPIKRAERWIEEQKERQSILAENKKLESEVEYKETVIIGLVDEIDLATKRQIINRVVRKVGSKYQDRWRELYKQAIRDEISCQSNP